MTAALACLMCGTPFYALGMIAEIFDKAEPRVYYALLAVGSWAFFLDAVLVAAPAPAAIFGLSAVYNTWQWWKNRRKGGWKRAARELGAKFRARVQALTRNMTPPPIPSPAGGGS